VEDAINAVRAIKPNIRIIYSPIVVGIISLKIKGIIFGIILVGFWLLGPFILGKKDEEEHSR